MLLVENLIFKYDRNDFALNIEHLEVKSGEIVGIIGNNGAGKSSFFKAVLDLVALYSGSVEICQINTRISEEWKNYTRSFLDKSQLIGFLTPEEYFEFVAVLYKISDYKKFLENTMVMHFFNNEIISKGKLVDSFSSGNKQKIGIIASLMSNPKIVFLDEPFSNLDPSAQICLKRIIHFFNIQFRTTFLISSHNLQYLAEISNRILLFKNGRIENDFRGTFNSVGKLEQLFNLKSVENVADWR